MKLIRVTEVLAPYYDWSQITEGRLEHARERGTQVHRACTAIAKGCWAVCSPEVEPYVLSFKTWVEKAVQKIHAVEPEFIDEGLGLVGHPDLIVTFRGYLYPSLVDLKTPITADKLWRLQIAAYCHLAIKAGYPVKAGGSLRLSPEGKIAKMDYSKSWPRDFTVFMGALNVWRFMNGV